MVRDEPVRKEASRKQSTARKPKAGSDAQRTRRDRHRSTSTAPSTASAGTGPESGSAPSSGLESDPQAPAPGLGSGNIGGSSAEGQDGIPAIGEWSSVPVKGAGSQALRGSENLAFAARVVAEPGREQAGSEAQYADVESIMGTPAGGGLKGAGMPGDKELPASGPQEQTGKDSSIVGAIAQTAPPHRGAASESASKTENQSPQAGQLEPADPIQTKPKTDSVRELALRLTDTGHQRVEVRLVERAGELRVAVHSRDIDLQRGLRDVLPDLVGRLADLGYRSETWRPSDSRFDGDQQQPGQPGGGWSQQQGQHQNQRQPEQPAWLDELQQTFTTSSDPKGTIPWLHPSIR